MTLSPSILGDSATSSLTIIISSYLEALQHPLHHLQVLQVKLRHLQTPGVLMCYLQQQLHCFQAFDILWCYQLV